jgi:hypothetical protein
VIAKKSGKPVPVDPMAKRNAKVSLFFFFIKNFLTSIRSPEPDPQDPFVFGPPGSVSIWLEVRIRIWILSFFSNVLSGLK